MNHWEQALAKVIDHYSQAELATKWMLVGSVGSILQGCAMEPNDIDVYTKEKIGVELFATLFKDYAQQEKSEHPYHDAAWRSSVAEPYFTQTFDWGFTWSKGVWIIEGFKVEVVHIEESAGIPDSTAGEGIWEGGQYIWELGKTVYFNDYELKVVPLEIQLESNLRRNRLDRAEAIIHTLKHNGYDLKLLRQALSVKHLQQVEDTYDLKVK